MERAPTVEHAFSPLDDELELLPGLLAPGLQAHLIRLAAEVPFCRAASLMKDFFAVKIHRETVRRVTERTGSALEAVQRRQQQEPSVPASEPIVAPCAVSVDGSIISLIHQQWAEVRLLTIGQCITRKNEDDVHLEALSYLASMEPAATFVARAATEMERRGVKQAPRVCLISDGAPWCQSVAQVHRPDMVRILDFYHAKEHIRAVLEAFTQAGMPVPANTLERVLHILKHRGPGLLWRLIERMSPDLTQRPAIQRQLEYLRTREALMHYPQYHAATFPIGSGAVESANHTVVQSRMRQAGMHWSPKHVNGMLALRTGVCNDRWEEIWQAIQTQTRHRRSAPRVSGPEQIEVPEEQECAQDEGAPPSRRIQRRRKEPKETAVRAAACPSPRFLKGVCPNCGLPVEPATHGGQNKRYCSSGCRKRAFRQREQERRAV